MAFAITRADGMVVLMGGKGPLTHRQAEEYNSHVIIVGKPSSNLEQNGTYRKEPLLGGGD